MLDKADNMKLQMLAFPSCPKAPELRDRLVSALNRLGIEREISDVNLEELDADDARLRYGAPTILLNGRDLMGAEPHRTGALCCRTYELGVLPDLEQLCAQLADYRATFSDDKD